MADPLLIPTRGSGSGPSSSTRAKTGSSSGSGSKSGSKGSDPIRAAENRAVARENAAKAKAGQKYLDQAGNLEIQAKALSNALRYSYGRSLRQNLGDISKNLNEQLAMLKEGAGLRAQTFVDSAEDNAKATGDTLQGSASNMVRERADAMTQLLQQGAGETDSMRGMLMAARNLQANASDANRAYFDTARSINTGITDLNVDTKTALQNMYGAAEQEKDRLWSDFYNRRSESATQLGNIRGQQADYYASAREMGVSPGKSKEKKATAGMKSAYDLATKEAGKSYEQRALPTWVQNYKGQEQTEMRQSNTNLAAAVTLDKAAKAEGASLRRWAG